MSIARRIAQNTVYLGISEVIHKIVFFFLIIYATSTLGPELFGRYSFAFSFAAIASVLVDLGVTEIVKREISRDISKAPKYLGNMLLFKSAMIAIILILVWSSLAISSIEYAYLLAIFIACIAFFIESSASLLLSYFNAKETMGYEALMKIVQVIITAGIGFFVLYKGMGLLPFIIAYLIGNCIMFVITLFTYLKHDRFDFSIDKELIKETLKKSLPLSLAAIFGVIYFKIDTIMIAMLKGDFSTGLYNSAFNIFAGLLFIVAISSKAIFPQLAKTFEKNREAFTRLLRLSAKYALILGIPIAAGISMLSFRIMNLLYDAEYSIASDALIFVIWAFPFMFLASIFYATLVNIGEEKKLMKIMGIGAVMNIILNIFLISSYDYTGAAIATVITQSSMVFLYYLTIRKHDISIGLFRLMVKPVLSAIIMTSAIYIIERNIGEVALYIIIPVGALLYITSLGLLRTFTKEDINLIKEIAGLKK